MEFGLFWQSKLSVIERCPYYRGVRKETFDCLSEGVLLLRAYSYQQHIPPPPPPPGGTNQNIIWGGSTRGPNPYPFIYHRKLYPFQIPTEGRLLNFSFEKPLKYLDESAVRCIIFWKSHLTPKWQFSQPISILQPTKSLPLYITPTWKRNPFQAEPPRMVHYRECPPGHIPY